MRLGTLGTVVLGVRAYMCIYVPLCPCLRPPVRRGRMDSCNTCLVDNKVLIFRVEGRADADRDGRVVRYVAKREVDNYGDFESSEAFFKDIFQSLAIFLATLGFGIMAIGIHTNGNPRDLLKNADI